MANPNPKTKHLEATQFKEGDDPRRNTDGKNKGSVSLTTAVKEFLKEKAKDGETYESKLKKAAVLRAISKSDVLMKEIWDRIDGKVKQETDITSGGEKITALTQIQTATKEILNGQDKTISGEQV